MPRRLSHTIYVGNLPGDIRESEVEDLFYKYGPIVEIDLKIPPRPPGFAFVEFEDVRDAEDAVYGRDRYDFDGHRLRVEFAHGGRSSSDTYSSYGGSSYRGGGAPKHTDYRVMVTGLPSSASWQDLKDHMRRAGEVCFSDVYKDRRYGGMVGVVDYASYDDMKRAVRKLDDTEFRNAFSRAYIRVKEYNSSPDNRSRSRSYSSERSYSRSRSYSISPKRRSYRSYSRSPSVSKSRSPSRSLSSFSLFHSSSTSQRCGVGHGGVISLAHQSLLKFILCKRISGLSLLIKECVWTLILDLMCKLVSWVIWWFCEQVGLECR